MVAESGGGRVVHTKSPSVMPGILHKHEMNSGLLIFHLYSLRKKNGDWKVRFLDGVLYIFYEIQQ